ncbi:MAG: ionic transporter y4hA [Gammaproteobacteria bacterium 28-57-27]|nr:MAG: ionic transporter y4hA [Gammaproteobacteria bacterium 28-57-27]
MSKTQFHALAPFVALGVFILAHFFHGEAWIVGLGGMTILVAVMTAVHHADVVAHRVGEPYGALILALAVTVIEVALIISMMLQGDDDGAEHATLTRDAIFATIMIVTNGVIGLSLLLGGLRHHTQSFRVEGAAPALAVLIALSVLTLVLPRFTTSTPDATYTTTQLAFDAVVSLTLWSVFIFSQTVRHRADFLPVYASEPQIHKVAHGTTHERPGMRAALASLALLLVALIAVVGLAEALAPSVEQAVDTLGLPKAVIGIVIAMLVLLPETLTAIRAAINNRLQTSINLALGSGLASIGLTIPVVAVTAMVLGLPLELGLDAKGMVLLTLSFIVAILTLLTGRSTIMQGAVHLVIFAAFLFLSIVP